MTNNKPSITKIKWLLCALCALCVRPSFAQSTVTGTILTTTGAPDSTLVLFTPKSTPLTLPPQLVASTFQSVTSAVDGTFSMMLEQGNYEVTIGRTARDKFLIAVPAGNATWPISSLIVSNLTYAFPYSPAYEMLINKGQTNGYAALDTNGFVPLSELYPSVTNGGGGGTAVYGTNGVTGATNNGAVALSLATSASNALTAFTLSTALNVSNTLTLYANTIGVNATNDDLLTSNLVWSLLSVQSLSLSTNSTNETLLIGARATNNDLLTSNGVVSFDLSAFGILSGGNTWTGNQTITGQLNVTGPGSNNVTGSAHFGAQINLDGAASTASNQVFGANNLLTGSLGNAQYGQLASANAWGGNNTFAGALIISNGWWFTNSGTTTIATGAGAGTGSPSASLSGDPKATDWCGTVSLTSGTSPSASATIVTITFAHTFQNAPTVLLTPANVNTPGKVTAYYVSSTSTSWTISSGSANNLAAGTTYAWNYLVVGQ